MQIAAFASITIICYLVGEAVKATAVKNEYIPVICGAAGAVLGVAAFFFVPAFPAASALDAAAIGIVSGLEAVGVHQVGHQLGKLDSEEEAV